MSAFKKAVKEKIKFRLAMYGASGSGKTFTALSIAQGLGSKVCFIDTEQGSAKLYGDKFNFVVQEIDDDYNPQRLLKAIDDAEKEGFDVIIVDSMSHFWEGPGGFRSIVDVETKRTGNKFTAWGKVDNLYKTMVQRIRGVDAHVIAGFRAKEDHVQEKDSQGKTVVTKLGMQPIFRDGFLYEFDAEGRVTIDHDLIIGKTRISELDGRIFNRAGQDVADIIKQFCNDGESVARIPVAVAIVQESNDFEKLLTRIRDAETADALKSGADEARAGKNDNKFNPAQYAGLVAAYNARKKELTPPVAVSDSAAQ